MAMLAFAIICAFCISIIHSNRSRESGVLAATNSAVSVIKVRIDSCTLMDSGFGL